MASSTALRTGASAQRTAGRMTTSHSTETAKADITTGEPDAVKVARPVRRGADGKVLRATGVTRRRPTLHSSVVRPAEVLRPAVIEAVPSITGGALRQSLRGAALPPLRTRRDAGGLAGVSRRPHPAADPAPHPPGRHTPGRPHRGAQGGPGSRERRKRAPGSSPRPATSSSTTATTTGSYEGFADPWEDDIIAEGTEEWRKAIALMDAVGRLADWLEEDLSCLGERQRVSVGWLVL